MNISNHFAQHSGPDTSFLEAELLDRRREIMALEARLAAVIAVCDDPPTPSRMLIPYIRAAATGGTNA